MLPNYWAELQYTPSESFLKTYSASFFTDDLSLAILPALLARPDDLKIC